MDLQQLGLERPPFAPEHDRHFFYSGNRHGAAVGFLERVFSAPDALVSLGGAPGTGKSAVLQHVLEQLGGKVRYGRIGSECRNGGAFLHAVLEGFGFEPLEATAAELRNLLNVFLVQVAQEEGTAVLEYPEPGIVPHDVMTELDWLIEAADDHRSLKVVFTGGDALERFLVHPELRPFTQRVRLRHRLEPMGARETREYLHHRLEAAGCPQPVAVLGRDAATAIFAATGGVPERVNRLADEVLRRAAAERMSEASVDLVAEAAEDLDMADLSGVLPRDCSLEILKNGAPYLEVPLEGTRVLIGRHAYNDIRLKDDSVSRHHALLVPDGLAWVLVDLNSTNGVFIRNRAVRHRILKDGDQIGIGVFRIRFRGGGGGGPRPAADDPRKTVVLDEE